MILSRSSLESESRTGLPHLLLLPIAVNSPTILSVNCCAGDLETGVPAPADLSLSSLLINNWTAFSHFFTTAFAIANGFSPTPEAGLVTVVLARACSYKSSKDSTICRDLSFSSFFTKPWIACTIRLKTNSTITTAMMVFKTPRFMKILLRLGLTSDRHSAPGVQTEDWFGYWRPVYPETSATLELQ